ncbi:AAA family ATPase [Streptosporangium sp. CA-135522]|uniref:AAA family ATPase n=1 Tax=Streptosporangium sp. CA-135522 TaxID=3240072 RepID=UPI003D926458
MLIGTPGGWPLMAAARSAWESRGLVVAGAATAAVAAANLTVESGIASRTIAAWVARTNDPGRHGLDGIDVLVIDEAATVDDRDLAVLPADWQRARTPYRADVHDELAAVRQTPDGADEPLGADHRPGVQQEVGQDGAMPWRGGRHLAPGRGNHRRPKRREPRAHHSSAGQGRYVVIHSDRIGNLSAAPHML